MRFGDLLTSVGGAPVQHPEVVLRAIREADGPLALELVRDGQREHVEASVSHREHELTEVHIPLLVSYSRQRGTTSFSMLLGVFAWEHTQAAWELRLLWLLSLGGGDADRLHEVDI